MANPNVQPKSTNKTTNKVHNNVSDIQYNKKDLALNGKLYTSSDGTLIGPSDFQTLTNFEYTNANIKSVSGMTKINTSAPTYLKHRNMFQFKKTKPIEDHLLFQSYNANENASIIQEMTQAPPAQGNFSSTAVYTIGTTWTAGTAYSIGAKVFPTTSNGYYYVCGKAGTSHTSEPTWGTTEFEYTTDNTIKWICKKGKLRGLFSKAPDGCMAYANGEDVLVWGGNNYRTAKFINYDPSDLFFYDYTNRINNSSVNSEDIAVLKPTVGGVDSSTELLLHFEDNLTDSSSNTHTVTAVGGAAYNSSGKFSKSYTCDGAADCLVVPDDDVFDFSGGSWSVDCWYDSAVLTGTQSLYFQGDATTPTEDFFKIAITSAGAVTLTIYESNAEIFSMSTGAGVITTGAGYQHIEVTENGDNFYIFVGGVLKAYATSTERAVNYNGDVIIGAKSDYDVPTYSEYLNGYLDEFRVSSRYRHTSDFSVMTAIYGTDSKTYAYLCSTLPISGINWYISTPNTTICAAPSIYYWSGADWTTVGAVTDGTSANSKTMATTGSMTFTSTHLIAKQKVIKGAMGYWYKLVFDSLDDTTGVYYITTRTSMQTAKDVWDGQERVVASLQRYDGSAYTDYTTNVLKLDAQTYYDGSDWIYPPETFADLGSITSSYYVYFGFVERQTGIYLDLPHDQVNTNAATASIEYWDGAGWSSVGTIDDQTLDAGGTKSLSHSGEMVWNPIDEVNEYKTSVSTGVEFYYYRLHFSATLSANVKLDYASGIAAPIDVKGYNAVAMWLNSLWLIGQRTGDKNKIKSTRANTICVFNGEGSYELFLGNNEELVNGCSLFSRYLNNIEETLLLLKKDEVWVLDGSNLEDIRPYKVSSQYGITAKSTLAVCDIGVEIANGVNRSVAFWQSSNGIMMFDNGSLIVASDDIENYFTDMYDTTKTERLNPDMADMSVGFYDPVKKLYHWLFAAGTSTTLNREYVFDVIRKKWFRIDRTAGKYLQFGGYITDYTGNVYTYGTIDTGYVERLDYGNTFDGTDITSTFRLGDKPLDDETMFIESDIRFIKIIGVSTTSNATFTLYWYGDAANSGTPLGVVDQSDTTSRIYQHLFGVNQSKVFHGIGGVCVSNDSAHACEPLAIAMLFHKIRFQTRRN